VIERTIEQNRRMWAMLTEIANQVEHCGRHYTPDQWKVMFLHALGDEVEFLPALNKSTFIPYGEQRSSSLSKHEMSQLIEFITAWGTEHGVRFADGNDPDEQIKGAR
jgi:hypothetical protein